MNARNNTPVQSMLAVIGALVMLASSYAFGMDIEKGVTRTYAATPPAPERQTAQDALAKSLGCVSCHTATDHTTMHVNTAVILGCTDCHGGDAKVVKPETAMSKDAFYRAATDSAHVLPKFPKAWNFPSSATPERTYTCSIARRRNSCASSIPGTIAWPAMPAARAT